jgi:hypothetical protein
VHSLTATHHSDFCFVAGDTEDGGSYPECRAWPEVFFSPGWKHGPLDRIMHRFPKANITATRPDSQAAESYLPGQARLDEGSMWRCDDER